MTTTPNDDLPDEEERPTFSLLATLEFLAAFLWFYRRVWFAILLSLGVGYWVYIVSLGETTPIDRGTSKLPQKQIPKSVITLRKSSTSATPDGGLSTDQIRQRGIQSASKISTLVESGSKEKLIEHALANMNSWKSVSPNAAVVLLSDQLKVVRRLMTMELDDTEGIFALTTYIETVTFLDYLNTKNQLGFSGTREALLEVDQLYRNHSNPSVAARANVAYVMIPGYEFVADPNVDKLNQFVGRLDERQQKILIDVKSTAQLVDVAVAMTRSEKHTAETKAIAIDLLARIRAQGEALEQLKQVFSARIYFDGLDFQSLMQRIPNDDDETRQKVRRLFDGLRAAPDSPLGFYSTAASYIRLYIQLGKTDTAKEYLTALTVATAKHPHDEERAKIETYLIQLQKELQAAHETG